MLDKELSKTDIESLNSKNQACLARSQREKLVSYLSYLDYQQEEIEVARNSFLSLEKFLHYYEKSKEGSTAHPEECWFLALEMLLEAWKVSGREGIGDAVRGAVEGILVDTFLSKAKRMGYERPKGGKDE